MARIPALLSRPSSVPLGPFVIEYAYGAEDRDDEYRLRHDIFVQERGWLPPDATRRERDPFDDTCFALLVRDGETGAAAACQRFILPDRLASGLVTNVERFADRLCAECVLTHRSSWAEVSRSGVAPRFRWGSAGQSMPAMVAIKYASVALAVALARSTLFSFSDLRTARLTRRLGFTLRQVGPPVEFHGIRAPFRLEVDDVLATIGESMASDIAALTVAAREVVDRS